MADKVGGIEFDVSVSTVSADAAAKQVGQATQRMEEAFGKVDKASSISATSQEKSSDRTGKAHQKAATAAQQASAKTATAASNAAISVEAASKREIAAQNRALQETQKASKGKMWAMGQAGNQIADFAVMVEMGMSPVRAFTQQGAQMAGMFGPAGMVVGAIIGVAGAMISTLIPSFGRSEKAVTDLTEKLKELGKIEDLTVEQQALVSLANKKSVEDINKKIEAIKKEIEENEKLNKTREKDINKGRGGKGRGQMGSISAQKALKEQIKETNDELIYQRAQLATYQQDVQKITDPEREKTKALLAGLQDRQLIVSSFEKIKSNQQSGAYSKEIEQEKLSMVMRIAQMQESHKQMLELAGANDEAQAMARAIQFSEIEQLHAEHQAKITAIEETEKKRREYLAAQEAAFKKQAWSSMYSNLASLMNTESKKLFRIGQAAAIANATVTTAENAVEAYKGGLRVSGGNPAVGAVFAGAAIAAGAVQIANIAKQKVGGASSLGASQSFSNGQVVTNTAQQPQQRTQNVDVYLTGDNFSRSGISGLIDTINDYIGDGGTKIRVN